MNNDRSHLCISAQVSNHSQPARGMGKQAIDCARSHSVTPHKKRIISSREKRRDFVNSPVRRDDGSQHRQTAHRKFLADFEKASQTIWPEFEGQLPARVGLASLSATPSEDAPEMRGGGVKSTRVYSTSCDSAEGSSSS